MTDLVALLLGVVLVDAFVLARFPALFLPARPGGAEAAVTVGALALAAPVAWLVDHGALAAAGLPELGLLAWVIVAALAVRGVGLAAAWLRPAWQATLQAGRPRLTFDATAAGVAAYAALAPASPAAALGAGLLAGLLLGTLRVLFAAARERLDAGDLPAGWRGPAIGLVTAAILSLATAGMAGLWPG